MPAAGAPPPSPGPLPATSQAGPIPGRRSSRAFGPTCRGQRLARLGNCHTEGVDCGRGEAGVETARLYVAPAGDGP